MYGLEPIFWPKFLLILAVLLSLIIGFEVIMTKYLKLDKRKPFSYNHVNGKHKKIDWLIRIVFIISLFITSFILKRNPEISNWNIKTEFLIIIFLIISEATRAFMEWKYGENPKTYILTISRLLFISILIWVTLYLDLFKLF